MSDRLRIGTRKQDVLITEPKIEVKRPASKAIQTRAASVNARGQNRPSLIPSEKAQGVERLSQSISISNEQSSFRRGYSEKKSMNTSILSSSPTGKKKKVYYLSEHK